MINIEKRAEAPECLEIEKQKELSKQVQDGNYRCDNVLKLIKQDFFKKCYLCEYKGITSIDVEHFKPHKGKNIDLKFDYKNLYYACKHCNTCKLALEEFDDILDCTNLEHDVENFIHYKIDPTPTSKAIFTAKNDSQIVKNTIKLLDKIFNGEHTVTKEEEGINLRELLVNDILDFTIALNKYYRDKQYPSQQKEHNESIRIHLRRDSNFTAFKRWIIKDKPILYEQFKDFFV